MNATAHQYQCDRCFKPVYSRWVARIGAYLCANCIKIERTR